MVMVNVEHGVDRSVSYGIMCVDHSDGFDGWLNKSRVSTGNVYGAVMWIKYKTKKYNKNYYGFAELAWYVMNALRYTIDQLRIPSSVCLCAIRRRLIRSTC